jgi:hypothetical protein
MSRVGLRFLSFSSTRVMYGYNDYSDEDGNGSATARLRTSYLD